MRVKQGRKGLTEAAYADRIGISKTAVQKAKQVGRVVLFDDGSIDPEASDVAMRRNTDQSKQRGRTPTIRVSDDDGTPDGLEIPAGADFMEVKTLHERRKVEKLEIEIAKRRGELVERAAAEAQFFELARQERDSWLAWPARVSALMAAELGVEPRLLEAMLDRHLREHLAVLADPDLNIKG